jgi:hypothetical protein
MIEVQSPVRFIFKIFRAREFTSGRYLGRIQESPSIFYRKLIIYDSNHKKLAIVKAPRLKYWSFSIEGKKTMGRIDKKWSGVFSELFTDRDDFVITYAKSVESSEHKTLILIASLMIDIVYFEENPGAFLPSELGLFK